MSIEWTTADIPDQSSRLAIVTGANSGLGLVSARELARAGARVVMTSRNEAKGRRRSAPRPLRRAEARARAARPGEPGVGPAVRRARASGAEIDLLINNAGVMATPRRETVDGFELQFGTNHLGHFALTGLLLDTLEGRVDARVVTLSSGAHRGGRIAFDNLEGRRRFRWSAYGQSKLANLMFALELDRRLRGRIDDRRWRARAGPRPSSRRPGRPSSTRS